VEGPRNTTSATIVLDGLNPNTVYYARAYVLTNAGNVYHYSVPVREFTTQAAVDITLFNVQEITHNSALFSGSFSAQGQTNITEVGFVYSWQNAMPTEADSRVRLQNPWNSNFNLQAESLRSGTTYYVRAYARFGNRAQDVIFSDVRTFTTQSNDAILNIEYRDTFGNFVSSQQIRSFVGGRVTQDGLRIPEGFRLLNDRWDYTIVGSEFISITVQSIHQQNQPPPQNPWQPPQTSSHIPGYDPTNERPYMIGIGNGMFGPSNYGTYIEVAAMLYSLLADESAWYHHNVFFNDVDYSNMLQAQIVNFVASQGFMIGPGDGSFKTHQPIHRSSVAAIICGVLGLEAKYAHEGYGFIQSGHWSPFRSAFIDTDTHWSRGYVWLAVQEGLFSGYLQDDGTYLFKPDNYVTRAELAQIFFDMFQRSGTPMGWADFADVPRHHWAYHVIMNAAIPH
jgi:hypothetical protein